MWTKPDEFEWVKKTPVETLGMEGFCKVVCEFLHDRISDTDIYGFPGELSFEHVYLLKDGQAIDVKGVRSIEEVICDVKPKKAARQITREELTNAYFISDDEAVSRKIFETRFTDHVEKNLGKFGL